MLAGERRGGIVRRIDGVRHSLGCDSPGYLHPLYAKSQRLSPEKCQEAGQAVGIKPAAHVQGADSELGGHRPCLNRYLRRQGEWRHVLSTASSDSWNFATAKHNNFTEGGEML